MVAMNCRSLPSGRAITLDADALGDPQKSLVTKDTLGGPDGIDRGTPYLGTPAPTPGTSLMSATT